MNITPGPANPASAASRRLNWLAVALLIGIAAATRSVAWKWILSGDPVRFPVNDAYYHMLRSARCLEAFPRCPIFDPGLNAPVGAHIPWPPLYDFLNAATALLVSGGAPGTRTLEIVGALLPVFFGLASLLMVVVLGTSAFGRRAGLYAGFAFAILPAHVTYSRVGYADQHAAEAFFFLWILLAVCASASARAPKRQGLADISLALALVFAFWNWMGSGLYLVVLALFAAMLHVVRGVEAETIGRLHRRLTVGFSLGAGLLLVSLLLFGSRSAAFSFDMLGLTLLHVLLLVMTAVYCGALWVFSRRRPAPSLPLRAGEALGAAFVVATLALLLPGVGEALRPGLTALAKGNAWYRNIQEFNPLLFTGLRPVSEEAADASKLFGLGLVVLPVSMPWWGSCVRSGRHRLSVVLVLFLCTVFLGLTIMSQRFMLYLSPVFCLFIGWAWAASSRKVAGRLGGRLRKLAGPGGAAVLGVALFVPTVFWYSEKLDRREQDLYADLRETLLWLRGAAVDPSQRSIVLSEWSWGHRIQYLARKPVVASPFGTDGGVGAMEDTAAFFHAMNPTQSNPVLDRREVGFVLLRHPLTEVHDDLPFAPPGTHSKVTLIRRGFGVAQIDIASDFWRLEASRLFFFDGNPVPGTGGEALGRYRLLYESGTDETWNGLTTKLFKLFGVVRGALLAIDATEGTRVEVTARIETNRGRTFVWRSATRCSEKGRALVTLPYATGRNGAVRASAYHVRIGSRSPIIKRVLELEVVNGGRPSVAPQRVIGRRGG